MSATDAKPPQILLNVACGDTVQTTVGGVVIHITCSPTSAGPSGDTPVVPPPPPRGSGHAALRIVDLELAMDEVRAAESSGRFDLFEFRSDDEPVAWADAPPEDADDDEEDEEEGEPGPTAYA